jgi:hypothetical protein
LALVIHVGIPVVIGFALAGGIALAELQSRHLVCYVDADCPPGYECIGGKCLPRLS